MSCLSRWTAKLGKLFSFTHLFLFWHQGDPGCAGQPGEPGHQGCAGSKGRNCPWSDSHHDITELDIWVQCEFQVIKETLLGVLGHLETRDFLETLDHQVMICCWFYSRTGSSQASSMINPLFLSQDFVDLKGILVDLVSLAFQDRGDTKEIQVTRGSWVNQVPENTRTLSLHQSWYSVFGAQSHVLLLSRTSKRFC